MRWSYKTVHYELKKEGLLGGSFLDEAEVEQSLNEFGQAGWELISVMETQDGMIAIFKQPLDLKPESATIVGKAILPDDIEELGELLTENDIVSEGEIISENDIIYDEFLGEEEVAERKPADRSSKESTSKRPDGLNSIRIE